ncbi:MAG: LysM peptidoglycan-binding domain-containing M23 family metallopeptidase [Anaerolineae bacterium]|nr:LysM peptidoglycan-binding domain-containing M23 family metallopeptidase [Anaerolineae bacterium]
MKTFSAARGLIPGLAILVFSACTLYPTLSATPGAELHPPAIESINPYFRPTHLPGVIPPTPTLDAPHLQAQIRTAEETYSVQPGDTLKSISARYGISLSALVEANQINNPDLISVGQVLTIPVATPMPVPPAFKIIPDSELVDGPVNSYFNLADFVSERGGYIKQYSETLDGVSLSAVEIINRVAVENSVNPRLLLAVLDYQSGWLSQPDPPQEARDYPIKKIPAWKGKLYQSLSWVANLLNQGYYLWKFNVQNGWTLADGNYVSAPSGINAGTAGLYNLFSLFFDYAAWAQAVSPAGFYAHYEKLYGYPFDFSIEPLIPDPLLQPPMQLPFEPGLTWSFTGGPHAGWAGGSAWAGIDFAPPGKGQGCVSSDAWVTAVADGRVVYANSGVVILDLDGDGFRQTGWTVLYLHIESRERVSEGAYVKAGERIGHPSCEGGVSNGTHVHLARRYNGEWISADQPPYFNLDGWISEGSGVEYNGYLRKGDLTIEAWDTQRSENQIHR